MDESGGDGDWRYGTFIYVDGHQDGEGNECHKEGEYWD